MINIKPLASSSAGNCYLISDGKTSLLLEAGIRISRLRKLVDISSVAGCLVTHNHGDHSRAIQDLLMAAVDCYMSAGTAGEIGATGHRVHTIQAGLQVKICSWTVVPFATIHDAAEPLGFLLVSGDERLLFCTDSAYIHDKFKGLTHIMIECNYNDEILKRNVESGAVSMQQKKRLLFSHMGLRQVLEFLRVTDRSRLREVWLLHASSGNSDVAEMRRQVQGVVGVPVFICKE
jgi:phosphoribosyl 1,2-cyclic phosphodiesterase